MFFVYVLKSLKTGRHYKGQSNDLLGRLKRHNNGLEKFTSKELPWELVFWTQKESRSEAMRLEKKLKDLKSTKRLQSWIDDEINSGRGSRIAP